jgi:hypothetical protein
MSPVNWLMRGFLFLNAIILQDAFSIQMISFVMELDNPEHVDPLVPEKNRVK